MALPTCLWLVLVCMVHLFPTLVFNLPISLNWLSDNTVGSCFLMQFEGLSFNWFV